MTGDSGWATTQSSAPTGAGYDLRPLSTGEILDRTFQLYRSRFALFASLAALPAAVNFLGNALQVLLTRTRQFTNAGRTLTIPVHTTVPTVISIVTLLVSFALYGITQAATTWAVAEIYLGSGASVKAAWRTAFGAWFRYVRVVLRQYWSVMWLPAIGVFAAVLAFAIPAALHARGSAGILAVGAVLLIVASVIYAIFAGIRVSLAIPAAVIESLKANAAVRRSMALLTERKVRIFLMVLLLIAIWMLIVVVVSPLQVLIMRTHGAERYLFQMLSLSIVFLASILVGPIGAVALCLFYFDERVRHEGFDIEFLMQRAGGASTPAFAEESPSPDPA